LVLVLAIAEGSILDVIFSIWEGIEIFLQQQEGQLILFPCMEVLLARVEYTVC
jgi:hypothetical protein